MGRQEQRGYGPPEVMSQKRIAIVGHRPIHRGVQSIPRKIATGVAPPHPPFPLKGIRGGGEDGTTAPCSAPVDSVIAALQKMESTELKKVQDHLSLLLQEHDLITGKMDRDCLMWGDSLLAALSKVLKKSFPPLQRAAPIWKAVRGSYKELQGFVEGAGIYGVTSYRKKALYDLLGLLVVKQAQITAKRLDLPLTPNLVLQESHNLAAIFDMAYPGYLQSGMVGWVVSALGKAPD